jgi:hypothetical protein
VIAALEYVIPRPTRDGLLFALMDCHRMLTYEQAPYTHSELRTYLQSCVPNLWPPDYRQYHRRTQEAGGWLLSYKY